MLAEFGNYSRLIRSFLRFGNSAPHHYWGLYFFRTLRLRQQCALGHAGLAMEDFTLARFAKERTTGCRLGEGWAGVWEPPVGAACNASEVRGYNSMCPGAPAAPVRRECGAAAAAGTADGPRTSPALLRRGGDAAARRAKLGGGGGGGGGGNASRHRPSTRERLAELAGLRDAKLVSAEEYATARMSILDDLVRGVAGASRT